MTTSCAISSSVPDAWQRFPSPAMATKGRAIAIAAEFFQACHNGLILIVETFDQQMTPVSLGDDLIVAQQGRVTWKRSCRLFI